MKLPDFDRLSKSYLDYWTYPTPDAARNAVGGEAKDPDITNTCTIRLSHAMNGVGVPIPRIWEKITNRRGQNGKYYIIRVGKFRSWMEQQFGKPDIDIQRKPGDPFDKSKIKGYEGVIAFDIGFNDATGHFDLWYRDQFSHEKSAGKDYFNLATRVSLWHGDTRWLEPEV